MPVKGNKLANGTGTTANPNRIEMEEEWMGVDRWRGRAMVGDKMAQDGTGTGEEEGGKTGLSMQNK